MIGSVDDRHCDFQYTPLMKSYEKSYRILGPTKYSNCLCIRNLARNSNRQNYFFITNRIALKEKKVSVELIIFSTQTHKKNICPCVCDPLVLHSTFCVCVALLESMKTSIRERHKLVVAAVHNNAACVPMCV